MENSSHVELANLTSCGDNCSVTGNTTFPQFRCGPFLPPSVPTAIDGMQATIALIVAISAILLNGTVLYLVAHFKHLHQSSLFLALQLNISHIIIASTVMASIVVSTIARGWLFGEVFCQIVGMVNDGLTFVRFRMVLVFTLDRLFTVFMPLFYIKHGAKISTAMSATVWMGALIQVVNSLQGLSNCYAYLPTFKTCTAVTCSPACRVHVYTFVTLLQILGGMVPFALYMPVTVLEG